MFRRWFIIGSFSTVAEADFTFDFRTATMPSDAEQLVEDRYDIPQRHVTLSEWGQGHGETEDEVSADD